MFESIPAELKLLKRWVVWKMETRVGKSTKVPYVAFATDRRASSTDSDTWSSFADARDALAAKRADGIGFCLGDGYIGIDLDACRDPETGKRSEDADHILAGMKSYAEASPSGKGIHILIKGTLPDGWRKLGPIEIYSDGRYFTMTGEKVGIWDTIEDRSDVLKVLHQQIADDPNKPKNVRVKADPANQLIRSFDSSKGEKDKYTAKMDRTTGKASCNCLGWKHRMRSGHPCRHVQELEDELGIDAV
jgi:primase-polymerase (primpol)-like protein